MALLTAAVLFCVSVWTVAGKVTSVEYIPEITTYNMAGRVTGNTMVMKQPRCYFDNLLLLPCTPDKCEIWLVAAVGSAGIQNFDADKEKSTILSESPYPTAFTGSPPKNYYLTKVGLQRGFPCQQSRGIVYFRVGDEGNCTSANCNGILPAGSTVRAKYVLVDPASRNVTTETYWSQNITLYSSTDPAVIFDGIRQRSAGMIVITSILSVLLFLLLLLLIAGLIYANNLQGLNCSLSTCEIWLAVAREAAGVNNFDTDKVQPSFDIVSASPYPEAFQNKNYYVTRLGVQNNFLCAELPGIRYFRVGAEGNCSTPTCNGIVPAGSTARVKYLLIDPENRRVSYETKWSFPITLISLMPSSSIDDWTWKRSGGMVVITVITSCLLSILLLLVAALLLGGTATIWKTLSPFWGEEYNVHLPPSFHTVSFHVLDEDSLSRDDVIGKVSITKEALAAKPQGLDGWVSLTEIDPDEEVQGEIHLQIAVLGDQGARKLRCQVLEARCV
ncbi:RASL2 protein, partial [Atractosteus spatula]|nr:RASL2 protein [Atractosteus spatula]